MSGVVIVETGLLAAVVRNSIRMHRGGRVHISIRSTIRRRSVNGRVRGVAVGVAVFGTVAISVVRRILWLHVASIWPTVLLHGRGRASLGRVLALSLTVGIIFLDSHATETSRKLIVGCRVIASVESRVIILASRSRIIAGVGGVFAEIGVKSLRGILPRLGGGRQGSCLGSGSLALTCVVKGVLQYSLNCVLYKKWREVDDLQGRSC